MPNTREKLIELLMNVPGYMHGCESLADHLIANGVTLAEQLASSSKQLASSEWIPVTERLPEVGDTYLVVVKYKYDWEKGYKIDTDVATFYPYDNPDAYIDNRWDTYVDWDEGQQYIHITHWMPLPAPPKIESI